MPRDSLPPKIISHIRAQAEAGRRQHKKMRIPALPFVTISRQFGCHAYSMAEKLVEILNEKSAGREWVIYDRKLLEMISKQEDISEDLIANLNERLRSQIEDWWMQVISGVPSESFILKRLVSSICALASTGYVIIIGRGSCVITRELEGGIHVRTVAPLEWRIENLRRYPDRIKEASKKNLIKMDQEREQFIKKYFRLEINDPVHYHLVLNSEMLTIEEQVDAVAGLVVSRMKGR